MAILEEYRVESPCSLEAAALLAGDDTVYSPQESGAEHYWVAVLPNSIQTSLVEVGKPAAVGRLRGTSNGGVCIDRLISTIPKEEPAAAKVISLATDALLRAWLKRIELTGTPFEELTASTTPFTAPILERRGFIPEEKPDFKALGRGDPIATHRARLPAACLAYSYLLNNPSSMSPMDLVSIQSILETLRAQPPPKPETLAASNDSKQDPDDDPWEGMRRRAGLSTK